MPSPPVCAFFLEMLCRSGEYSCKYHTVLIQYGSTEPEHHNIMSTLVEVSPTSEHLQESTRTTQVESTGSCSEERRRNKTELSKNPREEQEASVQIAKLRHFLQEPVESAQSKTFLNETETQSAGGEQPKRTSHARPLSSHFHPNKLRQKNQERMNVDRTKGGENHFCKVKIDEAWSLLFKSLKQVTLYGWNIA